MKLPANTSSSLERVLPYSTFKAVISVGCLMFILAERKLSGIYIVINQCHRADNSCENSCIFFQQLLSGPRSANFDNGFQSRTGYCLFHMTIQRHSTPSLYHSSFLYIVLFCLAAHCFVLFRLVICLFLYFRFAYCFVSSVEICVFPSGLFIVLMPYRSLSFFPHSCIPFGADNEDHNLAAWLKCQTAAPFDQKQ